MSGIAIDLKDNTYGHLTVIKAIPGSRKKKRAWQCKCTCGSLTEVPTNELISGHTKSCGCKQFSGFDESRTVHGHAQRGKKTVEYKTWCWMIARCYNENNSMYAYYGGRGIKVCDRWKNSYLNFYQDMGPRPSNDHSIDRFPNMDGDYEPGNCRWATKEEQMSNRTNNINITWEGRTKTLAQWADFWQMPYMQLYGMFHRRKQFIVK